MVITNSTSGWLLLPTPSIGGLVRLAPAGTDGDSYEDASAQVYLADTAFREAVNAAYDSGSVGVDPEGDFGFPVREGVSSPPTENGGSLPVSFTTGEGPPLGIVTPVTNPSLYADLVNQALWISIGNTDTGWVNLGGGYGPFPASISMSTDQKAWGVGDSNGNAAFYATDPAQNGQPNASFGTAHNTLDDGNTGQAFFANGVGQYGVTPPASQPATPATLEDVIALLQSYGMSA
jgi:hypothetical protein